MRIFTKFKNTTKYKIVIILLIKNIIVMWYYKCALLLLRERETRAFLDK